MFIFVLLFVLVGCCYVRFGVLCLVLCALGFALVYCLLWRFDLVL